MLEFRSLKKLTPKKVGKGTLNYTFCPRQPNNLKNSQLTSAIKALTATFF